MIKVITRVPIIDRDKTADEEVEYLKVMSSTKRYSGEVYIETPKGERVLVNVTDMEDALRSMHHLGKQLNTRGPFNDK